MKPFISLYLPGGGIRSLFIKMVPIDSEWRDFSQRGYTFILLEQVSDLFINIQNNKNNIHMHIYRLSAISKGIKFNMKSRKT